MSDQIDLSKHKKEREAKEILRSLVDDGSVSNEKLEVMEDLLTKSNVRFASVADKVSIDFAKFVHMLRGHDVGPLLQSIDKKEDKTYVVVSSDLLADVSNCEKIEEDENGMNVLSSIFIYGALFGIFISLIAAIVLKLMQVDIGVRDLTFVVIGCIVLMVLPLIFVGSQPYLQKVQQKHNAFFQRLVNFFGGK